MATYDFYSSGGAMCEVVKLKSNVVTLLEFGVTIEARVVGNIMERTGDLIFADFYIGLEFINVLTENAFVIIGPDNESG